MATTHPDNTEPISTDVLDGAVEEYPSDWRYVKIAIILAAITAVEVTTYTNEDTWGSFAVPAILIMMAVKFFMVAWFFMHLKYDKKILSWSFYSGVVLALSVFLVVLATFNYFA